MATSKIQYEYYGNSIEHISQGLFSTQHATAAKLNNIDLDTVSALGNSYIVTGVTNYPSSTSADGRLWVIQTKESDYNNIFQVYFPKSGAVHIRRKSWSSSQSAFVWTEWHSLW